MIVLALDLGTQTGWCIKDTDTGIFESGWQDFSPGRGDSKGMRFLHFNRWLAEVGEGVALIAYERPHQRGGAATEVAYGFSTRVQEYAANHNIECMAVHTATLKKFAVGSGKASKDDIMEHAIQTWPDEFPQKTIDLHDQKKLPLSHPDRDRADALCLMKYIQSVV